MINVGNADRFVRLVLGTLLVIAVLIPPTAAWFENWGYWKYVVAVVGVVLLATAAWRSCPAYSLLGINTHGKT
jgi:hypothetical protein